MKNPFIAVERAVELPIYSPKELGTYNLHTKIVAYIDAHKFRYPGNTLYET